MIGGSVAAVGVNIDIGGKGGTGAKAGYVTVANIGNITTRGTLAEAILAKSLAGGGGSAKGTITGAAGMGAVDITIGGGAGGTGGEVAVVSSGALATSRSYAHGIVAQSHGGAGGHGGFAVEGSVTGAKSRAPSTSPSAVVAAAVAAVRASAASAPRSPSATRAAAAAMAARSPSRTMATSPPAGAALRSLPNRWGAAAARPATWSKASAPVSPS